MCKNDSHFPVEYKLKIYCSLQKFSYFSFNNFPFIFMLLELKLNLIDRGNAINRKADGVLGTWTQDSRRITVRLVSSLTKLDLT